MRLVSDFDGVWTFPEAEAASQGEVLETGLLSAVPDGARAEAEAWIARARAAALAEPARYGWAPGGRLTAFGDEDPFARHSALLHYIALRAGVDPVADALRASVEAQGHTLETFGNWSHVEGVTRIVSARGPAVLADAAGAGRRLLAAGVEVVVVSNSGTEKLWRWLGHAGLPCTVHPERADGALRLRGAARKFELDGAVRTLSLGDVAVDVARPAYEAILREEQPDAVVGDVFSLDLALPLALRREGGPFARTRLFWLVHPYTPAWLRARLAEHAPEVEPVEGGLAAVADRLAA
uniref:HAD family hydrolase n=1 Tax=Eiseniibacteriota bacterium TaxID=2212470 RepID=A0A832MMB8_UNCEI